MVTVSELIEMLEKYPAELIVVVPTVVQKDDGTFDVLGDPPALRLSSGDPDQLILISATEAAEMDADDS